MVRAPQSYLVQTAHLLLATPPTCPPPWAPWPHLDFLLDVVVEQDVRVDAVIWQGEGEGVEDTPLCGLLLGLLVTTLLSLQKHPLERRHDSRLPGRRGGWRKKEREGGRQRVTLKKERVGGKSEAGKKDRQKKGEK